jgi:Flp pilus assembly protein TadG
MPGQAGRWYWGLLFNLRNKIRFLTNYLNLKTGHIILNSKMKTKRIIKEQKGAALIEFAIVLIILVLLVIGVSEFGLMIYNKQIITNASREGARAGITQTVDTVAIEAIVDTYCGNRLVNFGAVETPLTTFPDGNNIGKSSGENFSVQVTYKNNLLVAQLFKLGPAITLTAKTLMYIE